MNSLLEDYLSALEKQLRILPKARRAHELREVRQHLQNAVVVNQEFGQSEDEAVQAAIIDFGPPDELGSNLIWAWRRDQKLDRRWLWGAATLVFALSFLQSPYILASYGIASLTMAAFLPLLTGGIVGLISPRRAMAGAAVGMALWMSVQVVLVFVIYQFVPIPVAWVSEVYVTQWVMASVLTVFGSWIGIRLRARHVQRSHLVNNG